MKEFDVINSFYIKKNRHVILLKLMQFNILNFSSKFVTRVVICVFYLIKKNKHFELLL